MADSAQKHSVPANRGYVAKTAFHMADAVGYLITVARDTGLTSVASKLASVRTDLISISNDEADAKQDTDAPN